MLISRTNRDGHVTQADATSAVNEFFAQNDYAGKRILLIVPDNTRSGPIGEVFQMIFQAIGGKAAGAGYSRRSGHPPADDRDPDM